MSETALRIAVVIALATPSSAAEVSVRNQAAGDGVEKNAGLPDDADDPGAFQATGFKIGEVTPHCVIIWTRVTARPQRNPPDLPGVEIRYVGKRKKKKRSGRVEAIVFAPGSTADDLPGAAPGALGETRVLYRAEEASEWRQTEWDAVDPDNDHTRQVTLNGLAPSTGYELVVEARGSSGGEAASRLEGGFRTAPLPNESRRVVFAVATCQGNNDQDSPKGFRIYLAMRDLGPDFFVHTGDIVYYDHVAKTLPLARYLWQRNWSWPLHAEFHRWVPSYFEKDDHDAWMNDCWPSMPSEYMHEFTFEQGVRVFAEQVPMGDRTYRTFRWGRHLQIWLVENRDFRSPNDAPDGPEKTIWGAEQKEWFMRTVRESDATFRVLLSPTPIVGPDRSNKDDNHANAGFSHEGSEVREFIASQENMIVICGDRHWQYQSVDPATGVREYACGPASNAHASGWSKEDFIPEYHQFLKVKGGFLSATVEPIEDAASLTLRFHDVDGGVRHTDTIFANKGDPPGDADPGRSRSIAD